MIRESKSISQYLKSVGENLRPDPNHDIQVGDLVKFKNNYGEKGTPTEYGYGEIVYDEYRYSFMIKVYTDCNFTQTLKNYSREDIKIFLFQVGGIKEIVKLNF